MPMPPPKPTTEARRDRHVTHEIRQISRALAARGPLMVDDLRTLVGAQFWEPDRFDQAIALAVTDGLVVRGPDGVLQAAV